MQGRSGGPYGIPEIEPMTLLSVCKGNALQLYIALAPCGFLKNKLFLRRKKKNKLLSF